MTRRDVHDGELPAAHRSDLLYRLLKPLVRIALKRYYRHIVVSGLEKFPRRGAVVVISNHQNAVMDPLIVSAFMPRTLGWLARADVFRKGRGRGLLSALQMMPVFRGRDKVNLQQASAKTQRMCVELLQRGSVLALFPEGTHRPVRHLFAFKKGFARIIAEAAQYTEITIVPVGIDYSNYFAQQAVAAVRVGDPIVILQRQSPPIAEIIRRSHEALQSVVIHGDPALPAETFEAARYLQAMQRWSGKWQRFSWKAEFDYTRRHLPEGGPSAPGGSAHRHAASFYVAGWLVAVPAGVCTLPVVALSNLLAKRLPGDPMFFSSIRFMAAFLIFPLAGAALFGLLWSARSGIFAIAALFYLMACYPLFWRMTPLLLRRLR
jgi:1-acyl-sn-glycerol-3-phosphate acyltransferase